MVPTCRFLNTWLRSLQFVSKKFNKHITNERGYYSDLKIGHRKNIFNGPKQALAPGYTGTLKFPHQKIGIKKEDDETGFDCRPPNVFHLRTLAYLQRN